MFKYKYLAGNQLFLATLSFTLTFVFSYIYFSEYWNDLGGYFFNAQGDGLKNYFTVLYHSSFGQAWAFRGFHYPYSESLFFVDGFPLISIPFSFLRNYIDLPLAVVPTINFLLLISIPLSAFFLSRILFLLNVNGWINLCGAILIALMSPQIYKFTGHYGLAVSVLIPIAIYLLLKIKKARDSFCIVLLLSIAGLIHPYLVGIISLAAIGYLVFAVIFKILSLKDCLKISFLLTMFIVIYSFLVKSTDLFMLRDQYQAATTFFPATWQSLLTPYILRDLYMFPESETYLGLIPISLALLLMFNARRKEQLLMLLAISMIIVSCGIIPILNFFLSDLRALARISWVSYYLLGILAVIQLSRWNKRSRIFNIIILSLIILWSFDTINYLQHVSKVINLGRAKVSEFNLPPQTSWHEKYQGIIPIPYYSVGSNSVFVSPPSSKSFWDSMRTSMASGLGLMSPFSAKGSDIEHTELAGIIAHPLSERIILTKLDKRPLLIVQSAIPSRESENLIINSAIKVDSPDPQLRLLEISPAKLNSLKDLFIPANCNEEGIFFRDFDSGKIKGIIGEAGFLMPTKNVVLFQGEVDGEIPIEVSVWVKNSYRNDLKLMVNNGNQNYGETVQNSVDRIGDWVRLSVSLPSQKNTRILQVWVSGEATVIDEFLIRKSGSMVCRKDQLSINNYPYHP